ncbi:unnamed protein product [Protopolystoma xenopodis]|uniref:Uncharacterized protein n=1 Tax=Protopolystoma xenopodis TaxID=117903 RepID=A0A448WPA2_9PLAT|nr:unnamed protein product [Protopolystoma xenopodis]
MIISDTYRWFYFLYSSLSVSGGGEPSPLSASGTGPPLRLRFAKEAGHYTLMEQQLAACEGGSLSQLVLSVACVGDSATSELTVTTSALTPGAGPLQTLPVVATSAQPVAATIVTESVTATGSSNHGTAILSNNLANGVSLISPTSLVATVSGPTPPTLTAGCSDGPTVSVRSSSSAPIATVIVDSKLETNDSDPAELQLPVASESSGDLKKTTPVPSPAKAEEQAEVI